MVKFVVGVFVSKVLGILLAIFTVMKVHRDTKSGKESPDMCI